RSRGDRSVRKAVRWKEKGLFRPSTQSEDTCAAHREPPRRVQSAGIRLRVLGERRIAERISRLPRRKLTLRRAERTAELGPAVSEIRRRSRACDRDGGRTLSERA